MNNHTKETIFIGVSWPYANGDLHIGHLAGQNIVCDVFARYHRQKGSDVLLVSGADAHGTPVTVKAAEENATPEETAEKYLKSHLNTFKKLNCEWDIFTTTESDNHKTVAQNLFKVMYDHGFIVPKEVEQYYDPDAKQFLADRYIEGICPHCGNEKARGDQCNDGCERVLEPTELINPRSKLSGATPVLKKHTILYFDLTKFQKDIEKLVIDRKDVWRKNVQSVAWKWLNEGLKPRPVTRKLGYGIPVPIDKYKDQDIYVWFEAVMGYLSAAIAWAAETDDPSKWEHFWKDPNAKHYYFIAKDNIPFHTFLWPAMIMAYNHKYQKGGNEPKLPGETNSDPLQLPHDVPSNQFLQMKGHRMSKSRGGLISANEILNEYNPDLVRYFFIRNAPENHDRDFTWKDFIETNNSDLVATLGNFVYRTLSFLHTKLDGHLPEDLSVDPDVQQEIEQTLGKTGDNLSLAQFSRAAQSLIDLARFGNKYFDTKEPWKSVSSDKRFTQEAIYNCVQIIHALGTISYAFMPTTANAIRETLGLKGAKASREVSWEFEALSPSAKIKKPSILFEKLEYTKELEQQDNPEPEQVIIATDEAFPFDFSHIDPGVIIGKISSYDPETFVSTVDVGGETHRKVVCKDTTLEPGEIVPMALPGTKITNINGQKTKIKASRIAGVTSEGMLCGTFELEVGEEKKKILRLPEEYEAYLGAPLNTVKSTKS